MPNELDTMGEAHKHLEQDIEEWMREELPRWLDRDRRRVMAQRLAARIRDRALDRLRAVVMASAEGPAVTTEHVEQMLRDLPLGSWERIMSTPEPKPEGERSWVATHVIEVTRETGEVETIEVMLDRVCDPGDTAFAYTREEWEREEDAGWAIHPNGDWVPRHLRPRASRHRWFWIRVREVAGGEVYSWCHITLGGGA
jgi:hypothetical protein